MSLTSRLATLALAGTLLLHAPARASDEAAELWLNPSVAFELDGNTGIEFETAQRFRPASKGRADAYFFRLWLNQSVGDAVTLSGGAERRINDGDDDETRFLQQVSIKHGILRTRLRFEQRLVDDSGRVGLRFRPRLGASIPLDDEGRWSLEGNAELFVTLRSTSAGGDDGLTGLRTQLGVGYDVTKNLSVTAAYLRQQDIREGGSDRVGHAPLIGIEYSF